MEQETRLAMQYATVWDGPRWRREFFLRDHHHLYSPWIYTKKQIQDRNERLLKASFFAREAF